MDKSNLRRQAEEYIDLQIETMAAHGRRPEITAKRREEMIEHAMRVVAGPARVERARES